MKKVLPLIAFSVLLLIPLAAQNVFADPTGDEIQIEVLGGNPSSVSAIVGSGNEYEGQLIHPVLPVDIAIDVRDGQFSVERFGANAFTLVRITISDLDWLDQTGNEIPGRIVNVDCGGTLFLDVGFTDDSIFFDYVPSGGPSVEMCSYRVEHVDLCSDGIDNDGDMMVDEADECENVQDVFDFGDAPDPIYSTWLASNGPRHVVPENPTITLGFLVDAESDAFPNAAADGDDNNFIPGPGPLFDDEDGVEFTSPFYQGMQATFQVTTSPNGIVDAWIDWNRDGDFLDASEQIIFSDSSTFIVTGYTISVPSDAELGDTYARYRISSTGGLAPVGPAPDGEVEDYLITILDFDQNDGDGDGVPDSSDNCQTFSNFDQTDTDGDGLGNVCDDDNSTPICGVGTEFFNGQCVPSEPQGFQCGDKTEPNGIFCVPKLDEICGQGTVIQNMMCVAQSMGSMIGGTLLDIDTTALLVASIGVNPVITGLIVITIAGVTGQVIWFVHKRKNK